MPQIPAIFDPNNSDHIRVANELFNAVAAMRHRQRNYFKHRDPRSLDLAKRAECKVDKIINSITEPKLELI